MDFTEFCVRRIGSKEVHRIKSASSLYRDAAIGIPALLGWRLPFEVEIWCEGLPPKYGPYFYRLHEDGYGRACLTNLVPHDGPSP